MFHTWASETTSAQQISQKTRTNFPKLQTNFQARTRSLLAGIRPRTSLPSVPRCTTVTAPSLLPPRPSTYTRHLLYVKESEIGYTSTGILSVPATLVVLSVFEIGCVPVYSGACTAQNVYIKPSISVDISRLFVQKRSSHLKTSSDISPTVLP
jgi:hypothetical protein